MREQTVVGGVCQWGAWTEWTQCPVFPPCPPAQTQERRCATDDTVVQLRSRVAERIGADCQWTLWSSWAPECPVLCDDTQRDYQVCESDSTVRQSRTRDQRLEGGECVWNDWSAWSPACPIFTPCPDPQTEEQRCETDASVVQTRSRSSQRIGADCHWEPWSQWAPACPIEVETCADGSIPPPGGSCPATLVRESQYTFDGCSMVNSRLEIDRPNARPYNGLLQYVLYRFRQRIGDGPFTPWSAWSTALTLSTAFVYTNDYIGDWHAPSLVPPVGPLFPECPPDWPQLRYSGPNPYSHFDEVPGS